jgi:RimJ/RimL family protein N-acetyltransferase
MLSHPQHMNAQRRLAASMLSRCRRATGRLDPVDVSSVQLRPAIMEDADLLLAWRNDPAARAASFSSNEISRATHINWLEGRLADPSCAVLIVENAGEPVGQIRLEGTGDTTEIHIAIAPAARGRCIGRKALRAAVAHARTLGAERVEARVKHDNEASLRAFKAAGFRVVGHEKGVVELVADD